MGKRTFVALIAVVALLIPTLAAGAQPGGVDKVEICHIPPGNPAAAHTITVGGPAVSAHLAHGDERGECDNGQLRRNGRDGLDLDEFDLVDVRHRDSGSPNGPAEFVFVYDGDVTEEDVADDDGFWIVLDEWDGDPWEFGDNPESWTIPNDLIQCGGADANDVQDSGDDASLDDDELLVQCDGEVIAGGDWARGLDWGAVIVDDGELFQASDERPTDAPDLVSVQRVANLVVDFAFDEQVSLGDGEDDSDDSASATENNFCIYDDDGDVICANDDSTAGSGEAVVTNGFTVVRVEFDPDDIGTFGDGDNDLVGDLAGGLVHIGAVQERSGDQLPNAPDEASAS